MPKILQPTFIDAAVPSAPVEEPPSYAVCVLREIASNAGRLTDSQLAAALRQPLDPHMPSLIVELVLGGDDDAVKTWYLTVTALRAQGRLEKAYPTLIAGTGTDSALAPAQALQQALLSKGSPLAQFFHFEACGQVSWPEQWIGRNGATCAVASPTPVLRDACLARGDAGPIVGYLGQLSSYKQRHGVGHEDLARFLHNGDAGGPTALESAMLHPDPAVLEAFLSLVIEHHSEPFKNPHSHGRTFIRKTDMPDADLLRILLPTPSAGAACTNGGPLRRLVAAGDDRRLRVYLKYLLKACNRRDFPEALLVQGLSACLPSRWKMSDLRSRQPACQEVMVEIGRRAVDEGVLGHDELIQLMETGRITYVPAKHDRPTRHRTGLLACFGAGARRAQITRGDDAARASRPSAAARR